jgi:hypothetical protein
MLHAGLPAGTSGLYYKQQGAWGLVYLAPLPVLLICPRPDQSPATAENVDCKCSGQSESF